MTSATEGNGRGNLLRMAGWGTAAALVLLPLVAMRLTDEVKWTGGDFVFAIVLIGSVGVALELAVRMTSNRLCRAGAALALGAAFAMMWINGAVSILGDDASRAKPLFLIVTIVAIGGAALARLRPAGMARAMAATAAAQAAIPLIAQLAGIGVGAGPDVAKAALLTTGFVALWLAAGWLFARAEQGLPKQPVQDVST